MLSFILTFSFQFSFFEKNTAHTQTPYMKTTIYSLPPYLYVFSLLLFFLFIPFFYTLFSSFFYTLFSSFLISYYIDYIHLPLHIPFQPTLYLLISICFPCYYSFFSLLSFILSFLLSFTLSFLLSFTLSFLLSFTPSFFLFSSFTLLFLFYIYACFPSKGVIEERNSLCDD